MNENVLDVTLLEPRMKHPTIFERFDALNEGQSLTILNDHDPKPLYYQMLGERGNVFTWEYLENGPEWWKVRISKRITGSSEETLGQIAAKDLRKARVFQKYGLDFCCGGKRTIQEACAAKGIDVTQVEYELKQAESDAPAQAMPYNDWDLDFLASYIVNIHHGYVRKNMPELKAYASKVMRVHGQAHPELNRVYELVEDVDNELSSHMMKEERILFPYIEQLVAARKGESAFGGSAFGTVQNPVNMMEMEHESVGNMLEEIREVTDDYQLPEDACGSYTFLFRMLQDFESDLHLHIHLENNILFPKAIELEKQLMS